MAAGVGGGDFGKDVFSDVGGLESVGGVVRAGGGGLWLDWCAGSGRERRGGAVPPLVGSGGGGGGGGGHASGGRPGSVGGRERVTFGGGSAKRGRDRVGGRGATARGRAALAGADTHVLSVAAAGVAGRSRGKLEPGPAQWIATARERGGPVDVRRACAGPHVVRVHRPTPRSSCSRRSTGCR